MEQSNLQKYLKYYVIGAICILVFTFIWQWLSTGSVRITTDNSSYNVTLSAVTGKQPTISQDYTKQKHGRLNTRVKVGTYVAQIQTARTVVATKTVVVTHSKTVVFNYKTTPSNPSEPVIDKSGEAIAVDSNRLLFLDSNSNTITQVDSTNALNTAYVNQSLQSVQWISTDYGVGQDESGSLYEINGNTIHKLSLPNGINRASIQYAVAANKQLYILTDASLYTGTVGSDLHKIQDVKVGNPVLSATPDAVAITNISAAGENTSTPYVEIVTNEGKTAAKKSITANDGVWSPDGSSLLLINNDALSAVYDAHLGHQTLLPTKGISTAAWVDDNTIVYASGSTVWSYNAASQTAVAVGQISSGTVTTIAVDDAHSFAYLATSGGNGGTISRVSLRGEAPSSLSTQLASFLPDTVDACTIDYINFTQPTILLQPYSQVVQNECQQEANKRLQDYNIDISKLGFEFGPILTDAD